MATGEDDEEDLEKRLDIRTGLLLGVPVLAVAGCVYFVGFFSTAGMPYFTLLELQDFVVAAAKTIPPVLAYVVMIFFIQGAETQSKLNEHYDELTEGKTPEEALILLRSGENRYFSGEIDFLDKWFKDKEGNWSEEKALNWKGFNLIWTTVWFTVVGLCIYGIQIPVVFLVLSGVLFTFTFAILIQYYWYRYDVDLQLYRIWFIQIMTVVFIWGIWDARAEQSSETPRYQISADGYETTTSSFRRVGSNILFYDQGVEAWRIVQREGAVITTRFELKSDEKVVTP